jgi:hypothetical protein
MSERVSNVHPSAKSRKTRRKKFYGNYLGIVVQNDDPEQRGRVKIYVPHISVKLYGNWDDLKEEKTKDKKTFKDKKFKALGSNVSPELTNVIDEIKPRLPWAECASPLMGESSSGRYNAKTELGTISDSARLETCSTSTSEDVNTKYKLNEEGLGESPGYLYETEAAPLEDAFSKTFSQSDKRDKTSFPVNVNKLTAQWKPSTYSNRCKGIFSVPSVGSHIWIWFEGGNHMKPVYFAVSHGKEDWRGIYESSDDDHGVDYPGTYENKSGRDDSTYNHNTETYRNKFVFNQKGAAIEICSTDNRELLKLTHYSGSFKEYNNKTTKELATNNHETFVLNDSFSTVRGSRQDSVDEEFDLLIRGDHYRRVGTFNKSRFLEWQGLVRDLANFKQYFEVARCNYVEPEVGDFQAQSPGQLRVPAPGTDGFAQCPMCTAPVAKMWKDVNTGLTLLNTPIINSTNAGHTTTNNTVYTNYVAPPGGANPATFSWALPTGGKSDFLQDGNCPLCGGTGLSTSSLNGTWSDQIHNPETGESASKDALIWEKEKLLTDILVPIEKEMGLGGSEMVHITKHKLETIGLMMNDYPCVRIDPIGKLERNGMLVLPGGVVENMAPCSLLEEVHVDDLPGGTYTLDVCNRFNTYVGAGGISFKTVGNMEIGGAKVTITGEQLNLGSRNEININSSRVSIVADILSLRQKNYEQVFVDSSLGISKNLVVGGGAHIEGELSCHHITAPVEIQETEQTDLYGQLLNGLSFDVNISGGTHTDAANSADNHDSWTGAKITLTADSTHDLVRMYAHSHQFKNVPLHLMKTSSDVRAIGKDCVVDGSQPRRERVPAKPVENQCKGNNTDGEGLESLGETIS